MIQIWLSTKTSSETRRAYTGEIARFLAFAGKPLAQVTLADLQVYAEGLARGGLKTASQNRALTTIKSLLSFGQETGYLPFNVGAAVRLRPCRDQLAQRILEESEVAALIEAAPQGRDRVLLRLLYTSGVRASELCGLKWRDALPRQEGGQITVFGKGGRTRTILLKPGVWQQVLSIKGSAASEDSIPQPAWRRPSRHVAGPPHRLCRRPQGRYGEEGFSPLATSRARQPRPGARRAHPPGSGHPGARFSIDDGTLPSRPANGEFQLLPA